MEKMITDAAAVAFESQELQTLAELQLALVGGGIGETVL